MAKNNQHTVPQKYLEYFTDPLTPKGQTPYVWIYFRKTESIKNKAPINFAHQKKFYNILDSEGNSSHMVEDQLELIEKKGNTALKKLSEYKRPTRKERLGLGEYIFSMRLRVPSFWELYSNLVETGEIDELSKEGTKFHDFPIKLPADSIPRVTVAGRLLLRMDWSLLIAPEGKFFITSDNPVVVKDPRNLGMKMCGFSSSVYVEVTFPVNRYMCLLGTWGRFRRVIEYVTPKEVDEINFETFKYSGNELYSSTSRFDDLILQINHLVNEGLTN